MNLQKPLLFIYLLFVAGSLSYLFYTNELAKSTQFAPGSFDRMREAAEYPTTAEAAQQNLLKYITLMEMSEKSASDRARMNTIYVWFAIIMSLPLATYAGQSMRDKLFVNRPANMPRIVFWTLWGVSTRGTAVRYMRLSILLAFVSLAASIYNPLGMLGLVALLTAGLYGYAIKWVDKNAYWANQTQAPFPMG
ncbi:MAG: hypothetical protein SynsKO_44350 [Synoicihabitans sp.]